MRGEKRRGMSESSPGGSTGSSSSSDPGDVLRNLRWIEAQLKDDRARLDSEEAEATVDARTECLMKDLKAWDYDAEDLLDEWEFEKLRAEVEAEPPPTPPPNIRHWVDNLQHRRKVIRKFDNVPYLGKAKGAQRHGRNVEAPPSSSFPIEPVIHGREDDMKILIDFLLVKAMDESLNVVPIVGAAGLGKTTLVQHIYHDERVSKHFKLREWVFASNRLKITDLMKNVVEALTEKSCSFNQLDVVQNLLKKRVDGHRFLLVLDNICYQTVDRDQWEVLRATLKGCGMGSVIILTTQDDRVADRTKTVPDFFLESLSDVLCWLVFQKHAFGGPPSDARLEEIGRKIVKECQGSPLVAKALGVRLRYERDVHRWEEFLKTDMWDEDLPELRLTYRHLLPHLKRCFVYCSMFPKGYLFNKEELVRLWLAQGFIEEKNEEKNEKKLEDKGLQYFDDLLTSSFFQKSQLDTRLFIMPNLLRTLAHSISEGKCLAIEDSDLCKLPSYELQKIHHVSLIPNNGTLTTQSLSSATHLRSFLVVLPTRQGKSIAHIHITSLDKTLGMLNRLRVLDVRQTDIEELPSSIGGLKHLRYLNLSGTKIKNIHASVFQLYNLQTLVLSCTVITELPAAIGNMRNLRHLFLDDTKIIKIPESIDKLSKLQTLQLGGTKIEELTETIGNLKWLKFLCLDISKIQSLPESICELSGLHILDLKGEESNNDVILIDRGSEEHLNEHNQDVSDMADSNIKYLASRIVNHVNDLGPYSSDEVKEKDMFENLQSHANLQKFSKLTIVILKNCMKCKALPQLGQLPLLKVLDINGMSVECVGRGFCGNDDKPSFRSLEKLSFQNMYKWQKWDGVEKSDFPQLHELILFNCPELKGVPCFHSSLTKLKVERCAVYTIPPMDSLRELELCACDYLSELPFLNSLCNLTLMYCQNLRSLAPAQSLDKLWYEECKLFSPPSSLKICTLSSTAFLATPMPEHVGS